MTDNLKQISKFLSLVLRHEPQAIGLQLDPQGWADVDTLIGLANTKRHRLTRSLIEDVVATSDKQRFALSADGRRIRANQGHSVTVDLGLAPRVPPDTLFHGTVDRFIESIKQRGLIKGARQHVHLSTDEATARLVGQRRGKPLILEIAAGEMSSQDYLFYVSANGVWLTEHVPTTFIRF